MRYIRVLGIYIIGDISGYYPFPLFRYLILKLLTYSIIAYLRIMKKKMLFNFTEKKSAIDLLYFLQCVVFQSIIGQIFLSLFWQFLNELNVSLIFFLNSRSPYICNALLVN